MLFFCHHISVFTEITDDTDFNTSDSLTVPWEIPKTLYNSIDRLSE